MEQARYRDAKVGGCLEASIEEHSDGSIVLRSTEPLGSYSERWCDSLKHWAEQAPDRVLIAQRDENGQWRKTTYQQMLGQVEVLASKLLDKNLSADRPVAILSGNSIEHLTLALAAAWIGVPHAAISPPYSLISKDFGKLRHIMNKLTPGLVFVDDVNAFEAALTNTLPADAGLLAVRGELAGTRTDHLTDWLDSSVNEAEKQAVDQAFEQVTGETILKFLFTSGSTNLPKAVVTTNKMLCANQQMVRQSLKFLFDEPPVLVDWLPWNHVFGGSHNVSIAMTNGGSLYIDDGNPSPARMKHTLQNLREISPTIYFNVPKGFEEIARAISEDKVLAESLLKRVKCFFFAGAGLAQPVWDLLDKVAEQTVGERIPMLTGLGMTETAPSSTFAVKPGLRAGQIGLPCPGVDVKLAPVDGKLEVRFRGPHVMPGYWREPELSAKAFDSEGFYQTGDAVTWADANDPQEGLMFDGRIAEDFKLSTGTFVSVGPLRTKVIMAGDPLIQDVVLTGLNRDDVGMLVFTRLDECAKLAGLTGEQALDANAVLSNPKVTKWLQALVDDLFRSGTGGASRIARAMLLLQPPSIDIGEVTDKGSINQRAVLAHRAALVEALYDNTSTNPLTVLASR